MDYSSTPLIGTVRVAGLFVAEITLHRNYLFSLSSAPIFEEIAREMGKMAPCSLHFQIFDTLHFRLFLCGIESGVHPMNCLSPLGGERRSPAYAGRVRGG